MRSDGTSERRGQWLRGVLDLAVLAALHREGEGYGYLLLQSLAAAGIGDLKGGTLYPLLNRLERDGLVTSTWRTGDSGPARKYFRLTRAGERELAAGSAGWAEFTRLMATALSTSAVSPATTAPAEPTAPHLRSAP